jgi:hypothetical protein
MASLCAAAITAWKKSQSLGKATRARSILDKMSAEYKKGKLRVGPNIFCFNSVIQTCSLCGFDDYEKKTALRIAIETYKDLERSASARPDEFTYSNFLVVLRKLLPESPKRSLAVRDVFAKAASNGYVNDYVFEIALCK